MSSYALLAALLMAQLSADALPTGSESAPATFSGPSADPMAATAMRNDARLTDVSFVDPRHGWAVGDRGTLWHTDDGGRHWQQQVSGVSCPLESVCFLDQQTGWAAGGQTHPYTHTSTAVVLATSDGGRHWRHLDRVLLPAVKKLRMVTARHGWALACPSALYPTGLFVTDSGGQSWTPLSGARLGHWLAADFVSPQTGAVIGHQGIVAVIQRGGVQPARVGDFGLRRLTNLALVAPVHGWLVGDGGLVMTTADLGASWQTPPGPFPEGVSEQFDFRALAVRGSNCWVAGTPGTNVFHSSDAGHTWTAQLTGTSLPIHALTFVDEQHGWAVGALGTIMATDDGGQTWRRQRDGGRRAALLGLFSSPDDVPLELFARLAGNDGYLAVVDVLNRRDIETSSRSESHTQDRLHEAAVAVGASETETAWRFPLRQPGLEMGAQQIVAGWDRANDARGTQQLAAHLVRQIRIWRPEVIVTHDLSPRGDDPLDHLIHQAVVEAVEAAADPTAFTQQITHAGLEPWRVRRGFAMTRPSGFCQTSLVTSQLAPRLGRSLDDMATSARGLLAQRFESSPEQIGFRQMFDHRNGQPGGAGQDESSGRTLQRDATRAFFHGLAIWPGSDARRQLVDPPLQSVDLLKRMAQKRRNMEAVLRSTDEQPQAGRQLLAQTADLTRGLDPMAAGQLLYHLAQQYYRSGNWPLAAETMELLVTRFPQHALSRPAALWLIQYHASAETAWREQGKQRFAVQQTSTLSVDLSQQHKGAERAAEIGKQVERTQPELFAQPELRFPLAAAHRHQGFPRQAERFYLTASRSAERDAWSDCARGEQWLLEPKGIPAKSILHCVASAVKPTLDGQLDDAIWQVARAAPLKSALGDDDTWAATVQTAYDREFLYLGIRCREAPGASYPPAEGPRTRDPDLSSHDRVEIYLDLDRDFVTSYRLTIDHRGHTGEGCWGDATWNPTWFVAAARADGFWTAEAAIPLEQLTGQFPSARSTWAVGLQRIIPNVGFQSWTQPAAVDVRPEGFGYLIFD